MSNETMFGQTYADQYDRVYRDKNYLAECDLLEKVFHSYGTTPVHTILDLGCGTGNHAIPLAKRGYHVTGVDRSAEMLAHVQHKVQDNLEPAIAERLKFVQGDIRNIDLSQKFDAVLMMFAVLGYQLTNQDVLSALLTVHRHLKHGGLFICDVWYGPAVLSLRPSERVKVFPLEDGKLIRTSSGILDTYRQLCEVHFRLWQLSNSKVISETEEYHKMRYFFPQELDLLLRQAKLSLTDIRSFDNIENSPNDSTWSALVIGNSIE